MPFWSVTEPEYVVLDDGVPVTDVLVVLTPHDPTWAPYVVEFAVWPGPALTLPWLLESPACMPDVAVPLCDEEVE